MKERKRTRTGDTSLIVFAREEFLLLCLPEVADSLPVLLWCRCGPEQLSAQPRLFPAFLNTADVPPWYLLAGADQGFLITQGAARLMFPTMAKVSIRAWAPPFCQRGKLGQPVNLKSFWRPQEPRHLKPSLVITTAALPDVLMRPQTCHGTAVLKCCSFRSSNLYRIISHNFISFQICHTELRPLLFTASAVAEQKW